MKFKIYPDREVEFVDISSELYRDYIFPEGSIVRIEEPIWLYVSDNGHRVFDKAGFSHYIPMKWYHLKWKVKDGEQPFVR